MTTQPSSVQVPETYDGREQAFIKHRLLESYLQKLVLILGANRTARIAGRVEICYVDCFAGPWGDPSPDLTGTSIAISLHTLEACRQRLAELNVDARMRALFVEKDRVRFKHLSDYLQRTAGPHIEQDCFEGDFVELRGRILRWCGKDAFTFFFVDPKGWRAIGVDVLSPLLARPRSEFLINFMFDFANRAAGMSAHQDNIADLLGQPVDVAGLSPEAREALLLKTYRSSLKARLPAARVPEYRARSGYARVLDPDKERVKYHLVYVTSHPRGITEFMEASEQADIVQKFVRAQLHGQARLDASGTDDMFGYDAHIDATHGGRGEEIDVDSFWLRYLASGTKTIGRAEFADILEQTDWFPGDLQASILGLIDRGQVVNHDQKWRRSSTPIHLDRRERFSLSSGPAG
jgi:three-Cys-motif partner protein